MPRLLLPLAAAITVLGAAALAVLHAQAPTPPCYQAINAAGKAACLPIPPVSALDTRSFGAGPGVADNAPMLQAAFDAAFTQGLPIFVCGGVLPVGGPVYYYGGMHIYGCPGTTIKKTAGGFAALASATAPGDHWVTALPGPRMVMIDGLAIDNNLQSGAALLVAGVRASGFSNLNLTNGAGPGNWSYTDAQGTGTVPNALLEFVAGLELNAYNRVVGGVIGRVAAGGACASYSDLGIAMVVPSHRTSFSNVSNFNLVRNVEMFCNNYAIRNDYSSDNVFDMIDASNAGQYCVAIGDIGRTVYAVGGTVAAGQAFGLTFTNPLIAGNPLTVSFTSAGTDAAAAAAGLAAAVNGNAALGAFGVAAQTMAGTSNLAITYPTTQSLLVSPIVPAGGATFGLIHSAQRNTISNLYCENTGSGNAIWLGANASYTTIDSPANYNPGSSELLAPYRFGSTYSRVYDHRGGTIVAASFTADCLNDPQPYLVNTTAGPVTATFLGPSDIGTQCSFADYAGTFGTNNLTLAAPAGWGQTIQGAASLVVNTAYAAPSYRLTAARKWVPVSSGPQ